MLKFKCFALVLYVSIVLSGCLSAPNKGIDCAIIENEHAICGKPEKAQFIEGFLDASKSNAESRVNKPALRELHKEQKHEDFEVGLFTAIFRKLGRLFGSRND